MSPKTQKPGRLLRGWRESIGFTPATALALIGAALLPSGGSLTAQDPPHWTSFRFDLDCTTKCHTLHQATGQTLTPTASNALLCQSCHQDGDPMAGDLPINTVDRAVPDIGGVHHAWDVLAVQPSLDTQLPEDFQRKLRVMCPTEPCADDAARAAEGRIMCSTCHNQHKSEQAYGGTGRVGNPKQATALGSTGTLGRAGLFTGPAGLWYLVEIVQAGNENNARFCYSKDNGISWFPTGCNPPGTTTPNLSADGAIPVALDSGVAVSFGVGNYVAQERWELSTGYPFLRWTTPPATLDPLIDFGAIANADRFCRDCHRSWVMTHDDSLVNPGSGVQDYDGNYKSHPVGVGLNANAQGYDRSVPLDGNGADQGGAGADSIASNDLRFDAQGRLQCLTCHGVHYVDSNTNTEDAP